MCGCCVGWVLSQHHVIWVLFLEWRFVSMRACSEMVESVSEILALLLPPRENV